MVVNHGKNLDDLMSCVKKIDGKTTICPLVNNKQSVILEASYRQGTLNSWIVKAPRKNRPLPTCFKSGQRFGSFKEVQKQLDKESIMFDSEMTSYVLCHLRTDLQKRYNKIVSKFYMYRNNEECVIWEDLERTMYKSKCSKKVPVTCVLVNEHKEHGSAKPYLTYSPVWQDEDGNRYSSNVYTFKKWQIGSEEVIRVNPEWNREYIDSLERHETNVSLAICFVIFLVFVCLL